jgi:hypothetical protein
VSYKEETGMTQRDKHTQQGDDRTESPAGKPSQAEGERNQGLQARQTESPAGKPSQAEGDRETVDEALDRS